MIVVIAPDKFKGSLSSFEVCDAIRKGIGNVDGTIEVLSFPMADGGDGFSAVMKHYLKTKTIECSSVDPLSRSITVNYQFEPASQTAIIESASASGLILLDKS